MIGRTLRVSVHVVGVQGPGDWILVVVGGLFMPMSVLATIAYLRNWRNVNRLPLIFQGNLVYNRESLQRGHVRNGVPLMLFFGFPFSVLQCR
jgi:hypothetical protein